MAVLPDYVSGTITLANGSTTVTGTGTMFQAAAFKAGDTLQIQNLTAVIASVNSNTSLTLTSPWTGTSLTNAPYRARYLPDGARVTAQTATLIELLGNGVLTNLAELGVEDGKVPVGNAAGGYELKPTSTFGIQDPNGSLGKLAALTLGNRQILQTDAAGALRTLALAANKFLRTDANGDIALSDLGAAAIALLNLAGTAAANQLPYLSSATAAALTPLTAKGRAIIGASTNDAVLAEILAAPRPSTSGRGLFASFQTSSGGTAILPAGGTYAFWLVAYEAASGQFRNGFSAGVSAGGSTVGTAVPGWIWSGVYWNLT
ncbi:hypothetical protein WYI_14097 [Ochrobactrum sp. CDB2]|nr:hypothetical protein WYI_14097 [Ochrobactrum sp. CDB2]